MSHRHGKAACSCGAAKKSPERCEAWRPANTYSRAERCAKVAVATVKGRLICQWHKNKKNVRFFDEVEVEA